MNLTVPQANHFWKLFERARAARGVARAEADAWRHELILQVTGEASLTKVGRGRPYEELMLRLAQELNDAREIGYWTSALERRARWLIGEELRQLGEIEQQPRDWTYARALYTQAKLPLTIDETPADYLWPVLEALDTHRRRILDRLFWCGPKKFNPHLRFAWSGGNRLYVQQQHAAHHAA